MGSVINYGFIGAAGSGKSTCVARLDARHHALAHPLKATIAFAVAMQFDLPILGQDVLTFAPNVRRIARGAMGVRQVFPAPAVPPLMTIGKEIVPARNGNAEWVDANLYAEDITVRDALIALEKTYKAEFRPTEQCYGTETIRCIAEKLRPGTWLTPAEEWTAVMQREIDRDNYLGFSTACDDVRHFHEGDLIAEVLGGTLVRVERTDARGVGINAKTAAHSSEADWMKIPAHFRLINDGPLDTLGIALEKIAYEVGLHRHWGEGFTIRRGLSWPRKIYHEAGTTLYGV